MAVTHYESVPEVAADAERHGRDLVVMKFGGTSVGDTAKPVGSRTTPACTRAPSTWLFAPPARWSSHVTRAPLPFDAMAGSPWNSAAVGSSVRIDSSSSCTIVESSSMPVGSPLAWICVLTSESGSVAVKQEAPGE